MMMPTTVKSCRAKDLSGSETVSGRRVILLEERPAGEYVPTLEEVVQYARFIGIDPLREPYLMLVAQEGIQASLPSGWRACQNGDQEIYYFNVTSGISQWEHPCDEEYRGKVRMARKTKEEAKKTSQQTCGAPSGDKTTSASCATDEEADLEQFYEGSCTSSSFSDHRQTPSDTPCQDRATIQPPLTGIANRSVLTNNTDLQHCLEPPSPSKGLQVHDRHRDLTYSLSPALIVSDSTALSDKLVDSLLPLAVGNDRKSDLSYVSPKSTDNPGAQANSLPSPSTIRSTQLEPEKATKCPSLSPNDNSTTLRAESKTNPCHSTPRKDEQPTIKSQNITSSNVEESDLTQYSEIPFPLYQSHSSDEIKALTQRYNPLNSRRNSFISRIPVPISSDFVPLIRHKHNWNTMVKPNSIPSHRFNSSLPVIPSSAEACCRGNNCLLPCRQPCTTTADHRLYLLKKTRRKLTEFEHRVSKEIQRQEDRLSGSMCFRCKSLYTLQQHSTQDVKMSRSSRTPPRRISSHPLSSTQRSSDSYGRDTSPPPIDVTPVQPAHLAGIPEAAFSSNRPVKSHSSSSIAQGSRCCSQVKADLHHEYQRRMELLCTQMEADFHQKRLQLAQSAHERLEEVEAECKATIDSIYRSHQPPATATEQALTQEQTADPVTNVSRDLYLAAQWLNRGILKLNCLSEEVRLHRGDAQVSRVEKVLEGLSEDGQEVSGKWRKDQVEGGTSSARREDDGYWSYSQTDYPDGFPTPSRSQNTNTTSKNTSSRKLSIRHPQESSEDFLRRIWKQYFASLPYDTPNRVRPTPTN